MLSTDWIEIRDGKDENSTLIGDRICGERCETTGCVGPYSSSGNVLYMHFHSHTPQIKQIQRKLDAKLTLGFKVKAISEPGKVTISK